MAREPSRVVSYQRAARLTTAESLGELRDLCDSSALSSARPGSGPANWPVVPGGLVAPHLTLALVRPKLWSQHFMNSTPAEYRENIPFFSLQPSPFLGLRASLTL